MRDIRSSGSMSGLAARGEVAGEVLDQIAGIVLGTVDEAGLASSEHWQTDGVETWRIDDPSGGCPTGC